MPNKQITGIQLVDFFGQSLNRLPLFPQKGWIRHTREGRKLTVKAFAERLGVSPSSAHELEQRELLGQITLRKLAEAAETLGVDLVYGFIPPSEPFFGGRRREPETIEELYYASQKNPYYKELFYQRILALEAEEEALVAPHVEGAAVGEPQVLAPLAGEDAFEHIPGLA